MKIWKKFGQLLILMFFANVVFASTCLSEVNVEILVDNGYPPYSYSEKGSSVAKGKYINVLNAVFALVDGYKVKMTAVPWNRGKKMMKEGEGLGLAPAYYHAHDWGYVYPNSLTFWDESIVLVGFKDTLKGKKVWPDDFLGLRIGNVKGFDGWGGDKFQALRKQGKVNYDEVNSSERLLLKLDRGRNDVIMLENGAYEKLFNKLNDTGKLRNGDKIAKGMKIGGEPVLIAYSEKAIKENKYPWHLDFRKKVDNAIRKLRLNRIWRDANPFNRN